MNKNTKNLIITLLQSHKKVKKYNPHIDCPKEFITNIISILNYDKLFNVIMKEFSDLRYVETGDLIFLSYENSEYNIRINYMTCSFTKGLEYWCKTISWEPVPPQTLLRLLTEGKEDLI